MKKFNLKRQKSTILFISVSLLGFGCAPINKASTDQASQNISDSLGCVDMQSKIFDSFYELVDSNQSIPRASELKMSLSQKMTEFKSSHHFSAADSEKVDHITEKLMSVTDLMLSASAKNPKLSPKEQIQEMIQYELESKTSNEIVKTHSQLHATLAEVKSLSSELAVQCTNPNNEAPVTKANSPGLMSKGINMVFATAYQSCRVLDLPDMDASTPSVAGITRTGTRPDGGGIRIITDLKSVQNTHYYIRGIASESSCFPVRNNPLIYDFAGEAAISGNTISFFKNAGDGTNALGIDCSAFVSAAIGVSGLRYKPGLPNKPIYTRNTSTMFIDAKQSNFTCFDNVTATPNESIKPGDIVGVKGHVVAIDKLGVDPFGLNQIKNVSECSHLDYRNFEITIAQSSPSKGAIGLNKYKANVYLAEETKMRTAFVSMGQQACLAKFQNKNIKPASSEWGFLRHKGTPECLAPRTTMAGETCTQACL